MGTEGKYHRSYDTAVGEYAGANSPGSNITGSRNTFIGAGARPVSTDLVHATAIGYGATVNQSNSLVLGSGVKVGIGTTAPRDLLDVVGSIRVNDNDIYLRGNNGDTGHGLGWYGYSFGRPFKSTTFNEGPVLYGYNHGALGTSGGTGAIALRWHSDGSVNVTGTLTKGGGSFKIDHPLDPKNRYLSHSFVESPDMKNIYDGVITPDGEGFATVELPGWFEALNRDFRYQLTVVGDGAWAKARIYRKMAGNRFVIQTDQPIVEVSWQVTDIRKDAYAEAHRIPVEESKPAGEQGSCLHPEACRE